MAKEQRVGWVAAKFGQDFAERHWCDVGVDESHLVAGINQRAADRQKPERRKKLAGDTTSDRTMRRIQEDNFQCGHQQRRGIPITGRGVGGVNAEEQTMSRGETPLDALPTYRSSTFRHNGVPWESHGRYRTRRGSGGLWVFFGSSTGSAPRRIAGVRITGVVLRRLGT